MYGPYLSENIFSPNTGKYGPEITPYLDTFHAVQHCATVDIRTVAPGW